MKFLKKNQVVVFTIGLMVLTAGYLNFTNNEKNDFLATGAVADSEDMASIGDAKLVSTNVTDENVISKENNVSEGNESVESESIIEGNDSKDEITNKLDENTIETDADIDEYFMNSRLERNTMYSEQIENYQCILNNTNVSEAQKKIAQEEIIKINNQQNAIMIAENLIKAKGVKDIIIFINEDSINVIVKGDEPKKEEIAQIQNIVTRELEAEIKDVHIMNKK